MFSTIDEAIEDIKKGKMIIVVDDENRENEGDLIMAGELATYENLNFMAKMGRGLICTPVSGEIALDLGLHSMVSNNTDPHVTAFTVSVDHKSNTTGISIEDRLNTIKALCDSASKPSDFRRVTIDGTSLTVSDFGKDWVEVSIIPHTQKELL